MDLSKSRKYRFFYHYHRYGEKKITVHFKKRCINVDNIICKVPCESKFSKTQPKLVMEGFAKDVKIKKNVAFIQ